MVSPCMYWHTGYVYHHRQAVQPQLGRVCHHGFISHWVVLTSLTRPCYLPPC